MFLAYASEAGRALIDRELYRPKEWTADRDRARAAGIADAEQFATKLVRARRMLEWALHAEVPFGWVTADEAYGQDTKFRLWLESNALSHVVAVSKSASVVSMGLRKVRADRVIGELDEHAWHRLSAGDGAHGQRIYDWAVADIRPLRDPARGHWLLARRSTADPTDIAYYVCYGPAQTGLSDLVRVAGSRWAIEESFQTAKNETGLDHYQTRSYTAWYRHITPVHGRSRLPRDHPPRRTKGGSHPSADRRIPLTLGEIRRLFNRITYPIRQSINHILHWSTWRRTSQHRARTSHYRRRHNLSLQY